MHSGEQNRLLESVPAYPAEYVAAVTEALAAEKMNKTQAYRNKRFANAFGAAALGLASLAGIAINKNLGYVVGKRETLAPVVGNCDGAPDELLLEERQSDPNLTASSVH